MKTKQLLWLTALLLACLPSIIRAQEYRDVVFLKNGSVIKGFYKELYPADSLRMETIDGGILVCAFSDIERIAKERTRIYVVNTQEDNLLAHRRWRPRGYAGSHRDIGTVHVARLSVLAATLHGTGFRHPACRV